MGYIATEKENETFRRLQHHLVDLVKQYGERTGAHIKVAGYLSSHSSDGDEYFDIVIKKRGLLRRPIITISPPYQTQNVSVRNRRFNDLGEQLKEETAKFWYFGEPIGRVTVDEKALQFQYAFAVTLKLPYDKIPDDDDSYDFSDEDKIQAIREVDRERLQKLLKSVN